MDNMSQNIEIGKFGEKIAANHLKRNGYRILENNFRCKFGEIDIIALHRDTMVFVEVKTRKNNLFGTPAQSVNQAKQQRIIKTAFYYLKKHRKFDKNIRFDIVEVWHEDGKIKNTNIIPNAFQLFG